MREGGGSASLVPSTGILKTVYSYVITESGWNKRSLWKTGPKEARTMKGIDHNWRKKEGLIKVLCKDCISNGGTRRYWDLSLIHISEPTRLGMISYAVFCLKKKKKKKKKQK